MDALYKMQNDKRLLIEKAQINFKKSPKERISKSYIETRLELLETSWQSFVSSHNNIVQTATDVQCASDKYFKNDVYETTEELYILYKTQLKEGLDQFVNCTSEQTNKRGSHDNTVKLPKISIAKFSGNYSEWPTFKDLFTSLIHNNCNLADVQKMHYLKGLLVGEAEQLVRHIPVTSDNYAQCWSLLNNRYNNKRFLSNCLLKRFMTQSNVTEGSSGIKDLLDTTMECLNGLKNLGIDISTWDVLIIYIISSKLDLESRKKWESNVCSKDELPTLKEFRDFLETRFRSLEFLDLKTNKSKSSTSVGNKPKVHHVINTETNTDVNGSCSFCGAAHKIANCKQFAQESYDTRHDFARNKRLCFNCLNLGHPIKFCRSKSLCQICKRRHHSLLHPKATNIGSNVRSNSVANDVKSAVSSAQASLSESESSVATNILSHFSKGSIPSQVLLATALVEAQAINGTAQVLRVLLDQGSQASFIAESAVQLLGLKKRPVKSVISGIGGEKDTSISRFAVTVTIYSRLDPNFSIQVQAFVLGTITSLLPSEKLKDFNWPELNAVYLADPEFHTPNKIDILLGADVYGKVLREGLMKSHVDTPIAQNTALGWILSGQVSSSRNTVLCHHIVNSYEDQPDENAILRQFWEIQSCIPERKILSADEQRCEDIYNQTTGRDEEGRYVVSLPFRDEDPQCQYGSSRSLAIKRFQLLENKFKRYPDIKSRYLEAFHEYIDLGHMRAVSSGDRNNPTAVYLPHHAVVREDKTTTKVRIVFDASMKGINGVSLNDDLMVGPKLQPPLRHIIMRWRTHPISLCADIVKMYRQVKIAPEHTDFQRVVWRDSPESEMKEYRIERVTFGTSAAPYLAVKTLQQLAVDEGRECPEMAEKIKKDFYVDDLMTGCHSVEEGLIIQKRLTELLTKGRFQLQKWVSSSAELNKRIQDSENQDGKEIKLDNVMKILGISWDRWTDEFKYSVILTSQQTPVTKRKVISDIARLFDPLGWISPCIVTSKIFIQKLWLAGLEWDEELTPELLAEWQTYRTNLLHLNQFSIPRWVHTKHDDVSVELHGFCDASIAAYAAVIYIRIIDNTNTIYVNLVTSQTRVAPVKQQSIPRLELMGAVLLSELIVEVAEVMGIAMSQIHTWTDSTVVLAWLSRHPSHWSTFVGNRVSTILSRFDNSHWAHVKTSQNPADISSRGMTPQDLACNILWTKGPSWLHDEVIEYPMPKSIATSIEQRSIKAHVVTESPQDDSLWTKFSSLQRLIRVVAYCRRVLRWKKQLDRKNRYETYLTNQEIQDATKVCIRHVQNQSFEEEINDIRKTGNVKARSKLKPLCPVIDSEGMLRVSGRIQNANLNDATKFPIILPQSSHFTDLLIDDAHKSTLHGGPTLMLSYLRAKYWIISAKVKVKAYVRKCVKCRRYSATNQAQFMGQLPSSRVTPARPFLRSGVDFAGPINIRTSKGRGHQSYKGYVCLFVCMVTKAVHLEVVSDLSSQGFIAGFKRFVARRGIVSDIWSDNGTNFVGASKELQHLVAAEKSSVAEEIREWLGNNSTTWHFIPPHSPNFGGLWEAGVKSTKYHLRRVIGDSKLTYEEMATLLSQVEACLNSRPLSTISDNSDDPVPLTPGHFLIGESLLAVPERNYETANVSSLRRWQITQRMLQDFWRRWSNEYLTHLLQRYKWTRHIVEPNIGDVVLVKEDNLPPARWLLGKIVDKHPGADKVTRVVTLKCNGTLIKRPTSKLCILPVTT